jgi:hypothetical protein
MAAILWHLYPLGTQQVDMLYWTWSHSPWIMRLRGGKPHWRTCTLPGSLMVSCGEWNTCWGEGQSGSASPGAAAQIKVRLRDWLTPKLPALSTPKRTCERSSHQHATAEEGYTRLMSCETLQKHSRVCSVSHTHVQQYCWRHCIWLALSVRHSKEQPRQLSNTSTRGFDPLTCGFRG